VAITTKANLAAAMAALQPVLFTKTQTLAGQTASAWSSIFDRTGISPAAGTLAGASTAAGVVPDSTTTGCPAINAFGGGNTGYLGSVAITPAVTSTNGYRFRLCDVLFKAGAYSFNAAVTLAAQPSYSSRIPGGDYKGTEIWVECVAAFTGTPSIAVTYTNQDGTTGRTTGTVSMGRALGANNLVQLPLQAGDTGVQKIESVTATVATVGTFNVLVIRPLWSTRLAGGYEVFHGPDLTDIPILYATSALYFMVQPDSATVPAFDAVIGVISG
jgi:hypothetical protein